MDGYAGAHEGSRSDPSPDRPNDSGAETGLEEPMWQLGLGSGGESDPAHPERPDEADCIYYLRTGNCGYGAACRFNHPRDRSTVVGVTRGGGAEYPERAGQPICQFYMRTGTCKFGSSCNYHHPRHGAGSSSPALLNYYGYPFRPGEKECSYYVKTGQCKFGATCKFHHSQPAGVHVHAPSPPLQVAPAPIPVAAPSSYPAVQSPSVPSSQQYGVVTARSPLVPSYVQGPYGPLLVSPSMVPFPSWSPYQAPVSPLASSSPQAGSGSSTVYGVTQLSPSAPAFPWPYQPSPSSLGPSANGRREQSFPDRPGQPECPHYMRTGDCKYGSSCKHHHPPDMNAWNVNIVLSPTTGLPIRPVSNTSGTKGSKNKKKYAIVIAIIIVATVAVIAGLVYSGFWYHRKMKSTVNNSQETLEEENFWDSLSSMPIRFSYGDLSRATKNFSSKIGQGGFGSVYLGVLADGTHLAVKKLEGIGQGKKEFKAEVSIIWSIHHVHLVKLKGFCAEGAHRLLVYEFMGKGSLDGWIFKNSEASKILDWNARFNIALSTAKGLAYLHEECEVKIVHCDIKPENVLLDDNFVAKVSDFGLAKLMSREESLVYTTLRGTRGYLAPEWITNNPISEKSDVYSYGMVLLEIIGGRKNYDPKESSEKAHFPSYAFKMLEEGKPEEILDSRLEFDENDERIVDAIKVALSCIQDEMHLRPPMTRVVQMLEGLCAIPHPPISSHFGSQTTSSFL